MNPVLLSLIVASLTWWIVYETFYSPKAQIKQLWEEIFKLMQVIKKFDDNSRFQESVSFPFEQQILKKKIMINALINYHFNLDEDAEYIEENKADL